MMHALLVALVLSQSSFRVGEWAVKADNKGGAGAVLVTDNGMVLAYYCSDPETCMWVFRNRTNCTDGGSYPALINTNAGSLALDTTCIDFGRLKGYSLPGANFEKLVLDSDWLGIAAPMEDGKFVVARFRTGNASAAVAKVRELAGARLKDAELL